MYVKKEVFKKSPLHIIGSSLVPILFTIMIIVVVIYGLNQTERSSRAEGLRILEEGLLRAAVTCYAVEGRYPDSLSYIEEHYGTNIDTTKYIVHYEIFASNIRPNITVFER